MYEDFDEKWEQHCEQFESILPDGLEGLTPVEVKIRVGANPQFNVDLGPAEFMAWLDEASTDVVVNAILGPWKYRTPGHSDDTPADHDGEKAGA